MKISLKQGILPNQKIVSTVLSTNFTVSRSSISRFHCNYKQYQTQGKDLTTSHPEFHLAMYDLKTGAYHY